MTDKLLCILRGPTKVRATHDAGERWCFGCRKRLPHVDVLLDYEYDPEDIDTYPWYDPIWVRKCSQCKQDRTAFPQSAW